MTDRATRGQGLLEGYLARKRAALAIELLEEVPRSGRILDMGCGSHPLFLMSCGFGERHGVDQILDAERMVEGIHLAPYDAAGQERLPFADQHFDAVTMLAVFEHIDPEFLTPLLKEIRRVLRPGGRLVLTTPAGWTDRILRGLARVGLVSAEEIEEHKGAYDHAAIATHLERAGFDREGLSFGTFEFRMNLWATATV